ncbi:hypothetical protein [Qipengyuania huizhouensis]|uniref:hypothetical protein n=1 Tax=Qipengyuania huizhouensis TaxID=2867245 RepID=UPI001C86E59F|nr:hypothetical protein [Qipengyuania huizhouensis]MBX7461104.1 hypothetical protein [Qipengyuania huizhouensis]
MSSGVRLLVAVLGSFVYWLLAIIALFVILLPCGMGPDANCDMASPLTFWLAVIGFVLIYVALLLRLKNWKKN